MSAELDIRVDTEEDPNDTEQAWLDEIADRVALVRRGKAELLSHEDFLKALYGDSSLSS